MADALPRSLAVSASVVVVIVGILVAAYFFWKNRGAADAMADRFAGAHRALEHKYYVDELYDAGVVQPVRLLSEAALWKGVDARLRLGADALIGQT